jgi:1-phosphofructokinase family hexose kinase
MILSLTLNPAVDKTVFVRELVPGAVNRASRSVLDPGGKGINVSRVVHRLGQPTIAFGFLAGNLGAIIARALDDEGVAHRFAWVAGETRLDVVVVDESRGTSLKLWDCGPRIARADLEALLADVRRWLPATRVLVVAGSVPPGVPRDVYARLVDDARTHGVRTILDADGETLRLGLSARPSLIKPNVAEAETLLGRRLPDVTSVAEAARELLGRGPEAVVVSMGSRGAICASAAGVALAVPPPVQRRSTVGSGDSLVAGLAIGLASGWPLVDGLRLGTAAGAATAETQGTELGRTEEIEALEANVEIRSLDGEVTAWTSSSRAATSTCSPGGG